MKHNEFVIVKNDNGDLTINSISIDRQKIHDEWKQDVHTFLTQGPSEDTTLSLIEIYLDNQESEAIKLAACGFELYDELIDRLKEALDDPIYQENFETNIALLEEYADGLDGEPSEYADEFFGETYEEALENYIEREYGRIIYSVSAIAYDKEGYCVNSAVLYETDDRKEAFEVFKDYANDPDVFICINEKFEDEAVEIVIQVEECVETEESTECIDIVDEIALR